MDEVNVQNTQKKKYYRAYAHIPFYFMLVCAESEAEANKKVRNYIIEQIKSKDWLKYVCSKMEVQSMEFTGTKKHKFKKYCKIR